MGATLHDIPHRRQESDTPEPEDRVVQKVLRYVDGIRDLKRIAATCGLSDDAILIIADELLQCGTIELEEAAQSSVPSGRVRRGRSSGMYSQVTPSDRGRRKSAPDVECDLSDERRTEIDAFLTRIKQTNYYGLLGVSESASKTEIRNAYFHLSKRFHPDSVFGHKLGSYKAKMEEVFKSLTDAYDTLGRAKRRERYDRDHGIDSTIASDTLSNQPTGVHRPPSQRGVSSEAPTAEFKRLTEDEKRARRQLHTRKLLAVTQQGEGRYRLSSRPSIPAIEAAKPSVAPRLSAAPPRSARPVSDSVPAKDLSQAARDLARSLKQTAAQTGGVRRVQTHVDNANASADDGDFRGAVNAMRLALEIAPDREDLRTLFTQFNKRLQQDIATVARLRATEHEKEQAWTEAFKAWKDCCKAASGDLDAHLRAVDCGLRADLDLPDCKRLAQKAVEIAPDHAGARQVLAKVYIAAGMTLNAKRELKKAQSLDPADKISEDLLRTLK